MQNIALTKDEQKKLIAVKKALLTDAKATPSSQIRNHQIIADVAKKYKVDTQVVYDAIDWHLPGWEPKLNTK